MSGSSLEDKEATKLGTLRLGPSLEDKEATKLGTLMLSTSGKFVAQNLISKAFYFRSSS